MGNRYDFLEQMWTKFDIVSARTVDTKDGQKYVVYSIKIYQEGGSCDSQAIFVERRYTDFLELYNNLRQGYPMLTARISFPRKVLIGNFSSELIQSRVVSLENFLKVIAENVTLLDSVGFKSFLLGQDEVMAKRLLEAKKYSQAKPLLERNFKILNKIHTERHPTVIVALCRLAACCTADPTSLEDAAKYAELALRRFDGISDVDLLYYYVPLLQMCNHLWHVSGRNPETLELRLTNLRQRGHKVDGCPTLLESMLTVE
ncbi:hypothetical protein RUM43_008523 [Polyplax serrata]|uniref:PX domain-containing protein n=1 Tax=Polyplax serrata TaxID=468196 RepID=A0AAN8S0L0_POLSC